MPRLIFISHPEVVVAPEKPIEDWGLSETGRKRAKGLANSTLLAEVAAIWSSSETKAQETAAILAEARGIDIEVDPLLGENDRSATGFLPPEDFERAADAFFAHPTKSFRGWESAEKAQSRIVTAVARIAKGHVGGDLAVVAHGAVGTLLYCDLNGLEISRRYDQPGQGHFWTADLETLTPLHPWRAF